jgi:hypothetical protein
VSRKDIASLPGGAAAFDAIDQGSSRYDSQKNIDAAKAAYKLEIDPDRRAAAEALFNALDERRECRKGYRRASDQLAAVFRRESEVTVQLF